MTAAAAGGGVRLGAVRNLLLCSGPSERRISRVGENCYVVLLAVAVIVGLIFALLCSFFVVMIVK
jgi:hypothetical protein